MFFGGSANAFDLTFYGSLRIHGESVSPDNEDAMASYTGFRDAYSRLGVKANHEFGAGITAYAQLELPVDAANFEIQDPWNQTENIRVAKIGVKGAFGNVAVGQMWMPYYNAIAYPVDMFSSYYSGFATFTTFRLDNTISYYTPSFKGFSAAFAYSDDSDLSDERVQSTVSYTNNGLTLSAGLDDLGGFNNAKIWGASLAWQATDNLYIGAKYETHDSDVTSGYGADGNSAKNIYAGYTLGKNTFKIMLADVDNYGENIAHLGWDYQTNDDLRFFVEYYDEEETAALTTERGGAAETCWDCSGGNAVVIGLRYDFSSK